MYDAREKAIRDRQWELNASRSEGLAKGLAEGLAEGEIRGEIRVIQMLQEILQLPITVDSDFVGKTLEELQQQTAELQEQIRNRHDS